MKKGCLISIIIGVCLIALFTYGILHAFDPEYKTVEIKQNVGGKLICESIYNADHHSWQYDIDYNYIDSKGDTLDFKSGSYNGREWRKNEQIKKYKNWLILITGDSYGSDRLILKNIQTDSTKIFNIDNKYIERDSLWRTKNIKSLLNYCCAETFIEKIQKNKVLINYKFRTDKNLTKEYDLRDIIYEISNETGEIKMTEIR